MTMTTMTTRSHGLKFLTKALLVAAVLSGGSAFGQKAPEVKLQLGGRTLTISKESLVEEVELGDATAAQILGANELLPNPRLQKYVNLVGRHVANQTGRKELKWTFGVIDSTAINAFAAPGGKILITAGLMNLLRTEDELAAVLGHEVAHVVRKHHYRVMRKQKMLAFGASAVEIKGADEVNKLSNMTAQILARGLDKKAELEADRDGMVYCARAGYDASALWQVLDRLGGVRPDSNSSLLEATHPSYGSRQQQLMDVLNAALEAAAVPSSAGNRFKDQ